jgi:hypothetical protein
VRARRASRLLRSLGARRFHSGDRVQLTVTAPHRRAEHILLTVRVGKKPRARLVGR